MPPGGNLGHDFINVVADVKHISLLEQLDHMEPSDASGDGQREIWRLNRLTLSIERRRPGASYIPCMVGVAMKP
jgi:hypothetical protein